MRLAQTQNSEDTQHANKTGHVLVWNQVKVIDP